MEATGPRNRIDYGHLVFATIMMAWSLWYIYGVTQLSWRFDNIGLVLIVGTISSVLYLIIVAGELLAGRKTVGEGRQGPAITWSRLGQITGMLALLSCYLLGATRVGLDVSTCLFLAAALYFQGERRPVTIAVFSVLAAAFFTFVSATVLGLRLPNLLVDARTIGALFY
jgi:hypothetical protein